ncbi:PP2C family protein-serine/threonine phosphatase [Sphaerisporangium perillae]|uniref:PP2C family protein-serine/threonine phosphatase n=1 Tax=Sphaerisporangium perillae TaxID=2935860 RepID=UPI00200F718B|nr:PP2C family protein-serine/threonine phosphatase [Sphaerisporangium perillae]
MDCGERGLRSTPVVPSSDAAGGSPGADTGTVSLIQAVLDGIPAQSAWYAPIRDQDGRITDFEVRAAGPHARDVHGRTGKELIGVRALASYPSVAGSSLWEGYLRAMETGGPEEIARYVHVETVEGVAHRSTYTVTATRVGGGLLAAWVRDDDEARLAARMAHTERLGDLGWAYWNLATGQVEWSEHMYAIHERDPADGPLDLEGYATITHADDLPLLRQALATITGTEGAHEFEVRVHTGGRLRHLRIVGEANRDAGGQALEVHGVAQDITHWRHANDQLALTQRRLEEELLLTAELQHIIMPVQESLLTLPGLRVGVRYDAAQTALLGGDWYQAMRLSDDQVLLAVGDVAGSGLPAASAMAKLRHAITGLAFADHDPDRILVALNRLLRCVRPDVLATAVVARYRPEDRTLTFTHAGHPPMLLVRGHTVQRVLHPGVLLGVFDDASYTHANIRLEPDDMLVMYTDGLIERPGRDLYEGLDILAATIAEVVRAAPADRLSAVMEALVPSNTSDDTCILVAHVKPNTEGVPDV